ncbi:MAG TPA: acyloxyacyl hydrolase [Terracidiphilus sp.]|nr:acyloxyacyl hydrolase [Terracidiphilus sp.]
MTGRANFVLTCLVVFMSSLAAVAESSPAPASSDQGTPLAPVAEVRNARSWEYGPFINWGKGVGDRADFEFLWGGAQLGKILTPVLHAGILSGQFEYGGNIMPLWLSFTPSPHIQTFDYQGQVFSQAVGGGTYVGLSMTPVIFRWNFRTKSRRMQPWFQGAGGLVYTTHKFPPDILVPHGVPGGTSVWNFSPQGGIGLHYFTKSRRSIDLGLNAVHISSASLGDHNPGVNASLQVQVGYTFWK